VEKFLDTSKIRYDFSRCDGPTLWDILWEQNSYRNGCSGHISDFIDRDIESRVKEMGPGGDYRESYDEYLKREELEDTEERRDQWVRDDVDGMLNMYYKQEKPKAKRSKYGCPYYFDFIEDVDDDIEVALALDVVELSKSELARLNRIYQQTPDCYEKWRRVLCARKLVREVDSISDARHGDLVELKLLVGLCPECFGSVAEEDKVEDSRRPDAADGLECPDCSVRMTYRSAKASFRYIMNGSVDGVDYFRYLKHPILALDERLPGESLADLLPRAWAEEHLVTRLKLVSFRRLRNWLDRLVEQVPDYFSEADSTNGYTLDVTRCRYIEYLSPLSKVSTTLGFHASGYVTMANPCVGDSKQAMPTREQLEECRDVLLRAGAVEAYYGRRGR
jgi:hypothetical protein